MNQDLDPAPAQQTIDTVRLLALDAVERARSGHPGTPMEAAPVGYLLFTRHLRHNPANPAWPGRDRFILSCGHASMLLYSLLHLTGYDLGLEDLRRFRQLGSRTPGHPEYGHTPGVETTTGPLGQGLAVGVGMAMGGRFLGERIDRQLFDYRIYILCSDGDLMEGVGAEAASLAGHLRLGNIVCVYLDNYITIEGETRLAFSEEVATRFLAYGWHVERAEGDNLLDLELALERAKLDPRPSLIIARTHIAEGSPSKKDLAEAHGAPLGEAEVRLIKELLGRDPETEFEVPDAVREHLRPVLARGVQLESVWQERFSALQQTPDSPLVPWLQMRDGFPDGWQEELPAFLPADGPLATRKAGGIALNALAARLPLLLGGAADLAPSTNTLLRGEVSFNPYGAGRNLHFGVREHAMGAILNGLAHTPGLIPYAGTFLIFSDYMRPPMRLAALMGLRPIYVFTHDSVGLGEDGPTHQPVEQLANLRAVPNLTVIRPADANETVEAWRLAIENRTGPTALILTRQDLPILDRDLFPPAALLRRGGYILAREKGPLQAIIIATGSEIHPALQAQMTLGEQGYGVRLLALPSWELFAAQDREYREEVLPSSCRTRLAVEAAASFGWERFVGLEGRILGLERFGASAPGAELLRHFGFTAENICAAVRELL